MDKITPYRGIQAEQMTRNEAIDAINHCVELLYSIERLLDKAIEALDRTELRIVK